MPTITKAFVDALTPPTDKPSALHWCSDMAGFGLRITSAGKKSYIVQGRVGGQTVRTTIGTHGVFTVKLARDAASEILRSMRLGSDPRAEKRERKVKGITLRAVADEYIASRNLKGSSIAHIDTHLRVSFAGWEDKPIADITRDMVAKRFDEIKTKGLGKRGAAPVQANTAFAVLRALVNYSMNVHRKADGTPLIPENPTSVLTHKWSPVVPRTGRIPDERIGAVWSLLREWSATTYNSMARSSLDLASFLLLTGCRLNEAASLKWSNVSLDEGWFYLGDTKSGREYWMPLSTQAIALLQKRPKLTGNPYIFFSWGENGYIHDPQKSFKRISEVAGCHLTPHDFRRTYTTIGVGTLGLDVMRIELLTGHVPTSVVGLHYLETSRLQYLRPQTQAISDYIERCGQEYAAKQADSGAEGHQ